MLTRFFFNNLYNLIVKSLKVECVRYDDIRTYLFFFSQYIRINRVNKKLRKFFEGFLFNRRVVFEYFLNKVFFRRLFLEFRVEFFRFRICYKTSKSC